MEIVIPWLDFGLKYAVLIFSMYYLFMKCIIDRTDAKRMAAALLFSSAMGYSLLWMRTVMDTFYLVIMLLFFFLTNCLLYRKEPSGSPKLREIAALSLLCFAFCEALFMLVGLVSSAALSVFYYNLMPEGSNSVWDFLNNVPVHTAAYLVMIALVWVATWFAAGIKRLRRGMRNIVEHRAASTVIMFAMLMLMTVMTFGSINLNETNYFTKSLLLIPTIVFCVIMIIWTRCEIRADYVRHIRERNLVLMEGSLAEKDREIALLSDDNEKLAGVIRRDAELLRVLTDGLKNGAAGDPGACGLDITKAAEEVERLYTGRSEAVSSLEAHGRTFSRTGDSAVDSILLLMAYKAEEKGIAFDVEAEPETMRHLGQDVKRREFNTVLADLTENAIISAGTAKDKRVEVMFGSSGEHLRLQVLDSGERFDTEVLQKMGRQKITTHAGEGGSGIGLMTVFGILRSYGASFEIDEYSSCDGNSNDGEYRKSVGVTFDGKGRLRIVTDRADELRRVLKPGIFEISMA